VRLYYLCYLSVFYKYIYRLIRPTPTGALQSWTPWGLQSLLTPHLPTLLQTLAISYILNADPSYPTFGAAMHTANDWVPVK